MKLPTNVFFFVTIIQVALGKSPRQVFGSLEGSITLPSGADPSWNLSSIEWSIFRNNTWIATYRIPVLNIKRIKRYDGRLSLDITSGDLTINGLNKEDNMVYTVDVINTKGEDSSNRIELTVNPRLQPPTIKTIASTSVKGVCVLVLNCSAVDKDVSLSWQVTHSSEIIFIKTNPDGNSAVIGAFLNTTQNLPEFICTSSRNTGSVSTVITPTCEGKMCE
uniref:CD48 antigen isoform X2 n=1 Tax=Semicossyphus pulcher TaxID=241346 RepID=UPI0037E75F1E